MCGGACVHWFPKTQKCVTLSTTQAEYVEINGKYYELSVISAAGCVFYVAGSGDTVCAVVLEDNEGAVQLAENPVTNWNSKHIDVCHHFLKGAGCERNSFHYARNVRSAWQHADFFTKQLIDSGDFPVPSHFFSEHEMGLMFVWAGMEEAVLR